LENSLLNVTLITCYIGRTKYIRRIIASFLAQTYKGHITLLLYNNGPSINSLASIHLPENRAIVLINNHLDKETGVEYTNTGAIFRDALTYVSNTTELINFYDSDDLFLPNHVEEGVNGYLEGGLAVAYKPKYSYHIYLDRFSREENNMEPSIFVKKSYVELMGFAPVSASYHQQWLTPLMRSQNIYIKEDGVSTFLYDWTRGHNTYKISGAGDDSEANFQAHRRWESRELDSAILYPITQEELNKEYEKVKHP